MKVISVLLFVLVSSSVYAQLGNISDIGLAGKPLMIDADPRFAGSPYLEAKWNTGTVRLNNTSVFENVQLRYNVLEDVPEFTKDEKAYALDPLKVREFTYVSYNTEGSKSYIFRNGFTDIPGFGAKNYFEVLYDGEILLLKKFSKQIINDPNATYGSTANKVIQDKQDLFFRIDDRNAGNLKTNKKFVLSLFPGKEKAIEDYVKVNKLTYKFENDLVLIFAFVDSI